MGVCVSGGPGTAWVGVCLVGQVLHGWVGVWWARHCVCVCVCVCACVRACVCACVCACVPGMQYAQVLCMFSIVLFNNISL